jgi:hypothetical protein
MKKVIITIVSLFYISAYAVELDLPKPHELLLEDIVESPEPEEEAEVSEQFA